MRKNEVLSLVGYLYNVEERLERAVSDCSFRFIRRELDSVDLLEEIIAKEQLNFFQEVSSDIIEILRLNEQASCDKVFDELKQKL